MPQKARIVRDGVIQVVQVENIVVGDIVLIKAGDKVPADMRLFEADKLYVKILSKLKNTIFRDIFGKRLYSHIYEPTIWPSN